MARTDFIENDRVLVTNRNGTSFRGLLSQLVTYIGSFLRPYKVYTFEITAVALMDPMVTVFENTIGNVVWTRDGDGNYLATLSSAFVEDKTWCMLSNHVQSDGANAQFARMFTPTTSTIRIYNTNKNFAELIEPLMPIYGEIRVYN